MYTVRITHVPAAGKGPELRAALEERSRSANAAGQAYNVTERIYSTQPAFVNGLRYNSLADREAYLASAPNDSARAAQIARINACLAQPQATELIENLVPAQVTGDINYQLRVTNFPAPGKGPELRQLLEKMTKSPSRGVVGKALSTQVAPPDGQNFTMSILFSSLAGLEEFRSANQTDAAFQAFVAQLANLVGRPNRQELYRNWLRFGAT